MSKVQQFKARKHYISLPSNYIEELQSKGKRDKARAFMEYFFDMHQEAINSVRFYHRSWGVSVGTVNNWINEFKIEIDRYFSFWMIQNDIHHTSVLNKHEQNMNTTKTTNEHQNNNSKPTLSTLIKPDMNTTKTTNEQDMNKDSNKNLNNINVESEDSTPASSKITYSAKFEILWNLYDLKKSSKKRSYTIYNKRWKDTDIELLKTAIIKAKEEMTIGYEKHFDGFLNGVIDSYIPRKAWLKDTKGNTHTGLYYETDCKFITPSGTTTILKAEQLSKLIQAKYFGYQE